MNFKVEDQLNPGFVQPLFWAAAITVSYWLGPEILEAAALKLAINPSREETASKMTKITTPARATKNVQI